MSANSGIGASNNNPFGGYIGDPPPYYPYPYYPQPYGWPASPFVDSELARALIAALKGETTIKVQVELSPENIEQLRKLIAD